MQSIRTRLYSFAFPVALLPLMDVNLGEIPTLVRRYLEDQLALLPTTFAELLIILIQSIVEPMIRNFTQFIFGVPLT